MTFLQLQVYLFCVCRTGSADPVEGSQGVPDANGWLGSLQVLQRCVHVRDLAYGWNGNSVLCSFAKHWHSQSNDGYQCSLDHAWFLVLVQAIQVRSIHQGQWLANHEWMSLKVCGWVEEDHHEGAWRVGLHFPTDWSDCLASLELKLAESRWSGQCLGTSGWSVPCFIWMVGVFCGRKCQQCRLQIPVESQDQHDWRRNKVQTLITNWKRLNKLLCIFRYTSYLFITLWKIMLFFGLFLGLTVGLVTLMTVSQLKFSDCKDWF